MSVFMNIVKGQQAPKILYFNLRKVSRVQCIRIFDLQTRDKGFLTLIEKSFKKCRDQDSNLGYCGHNAVS